MLKKIIQPRWRIKTQRQINEQIDGHSYAFWDISIPLESFNAHSILPLIFFKTSGGISQKNVDTVAI